MARSHAAVLAPPVWNPHCGCYAADLGNEVPKVRLGDKEGAASCRGVVRPLVPSESIMLASSNSALMASAMTQPALAASCTAGGGEIGWWE